MWQSATPWDILFGNKYSNEQMVDYISSQTQLEAHSVCISQKKLRKWRTYFTNQCINKVGQNFVIHYLYHGMSLCTGRTNPRNTQIVLLIIRDLNSPSQDGWTEGSHSFPQPTLVNLTDQYIWWSVINFTQVTNFDTNGIINYICSKKKKLYHMPSKFN